MSLILQLYAGRLAPLGPRGLPSGIAKQPLPPPWTVTSEGLEGDAQGDRRHHGGPEKALHHYAFDHYAAWRAEAPQLAALLAAPPAFGENISTLGMTEATVCVGDVYALGPLRLQVSQGRQPCWRLNARSGLPDLARRVQASGRTGWYYRVLRPGRLEPGERLTLLERPHPAWPLARVLGVFYRDLLDEGALAELAALPALAESWRALCRRRLETRSVEDWSRRLVG